MKITDLPTACSSCCVMPPANITHIFGSLTAVLIVVAGFAWSSGGEERAHASPAFHVGTANHQRMLQVAGIAPKPVAFPSAPITLPIEVMGHDGTQVPVTFQLTANQARATELLLQVHGLSYEGKASIQVNQSPWTALNNNIFVEEPGKSYGGVGGGFSTLKLRLALRPPFNRLQLGLNRISFRFNHTDGVSIGYRVLKMQLLDGHGQPVLPASAFTKDDPSQWQPPFADSADIAEGGRLWHSAQLQESTLIGASEIRATCSDCHAQDGRDLKYFNYSNHSIVERSKFHGLTEQQGQQISSYIRTLKNSDGADMPSPGRPWNPPYQPGPGLDSKPVSEWAAGAGIDAVLDKDTDMVPYLFPNGINKSAVASSQTLNMRELPIALQLIDWNHWLPRVHPKDAWGQAFTGSGMNTVYPNLRQYLTGTSGNTVTADGIKAQINYFEGLTQKFGGDRVFPNNSVGDFTQAKLSPDENMALYSAAEWHAVKEWELMQEFNLEGRGPDFFGAKAEGERQWLSSTAFFSSPAQMKIPAAGEAGTPWNDNITFAYLNNSWYHLQLIQNAGNRQRAGNNPVDWGYLPGRTIDLLYSTTRHVDIVRLTAGLIKGMQEQDNGVGPQGNFGFAPNGMSDPAILGLPFFRTGGDNTDYNAGAWKAAPAGTRAKVLTAYLGASFDMLQRFTPQQYYQEDGYGGIAQPDEDPSIYNNRLGYKLYTTIPTYRAIGVDGTLLNSMCDWGKTVWPKGDWAKMKK